MHIYYDGDLTSENVGHSKMMLGQNHSESSTCLSFDAFVVARLAFCFKSCLTVWKLRTCLQRIVRKQFANKLADPGRS